MRSASVFALADDLSGAAEVAALLMAPARSARIALSGPPYAFAAPVVVADLDCRYREEAGELVREALRHAGERRVFVKIDSLLRGNLVATAAATLHTSAPHDAVVRDAAVCDAAVCEGGACDAAVHDVAVRDAAVGEAGVRDASASLAPAGPAQASHLPAPALVVLAPALPAAGRVTVGGVAYIGGLSLRETRAWQVERRPAPASVTEALGGVPSAIVPLAAVRAGHDTLVRTLAQTAGRIAVCDAETDSDLSAIVSAALAADHRARFIGAGGLASALGRFLDAQPAIIAHADAHPPIIVRADAHPPIAPGSGTHHSITARVDALPPAAPRMGALLPAGHGEGRTGARPLLVVVGTAEPGAAEQARLLLSYGAHPITLDAATDLAATSAHRTHLAQRLRQALGQTTAATATTATVVLTISGQAPPTAATTLADLVGAALTGHTPAPDLVLTGGETARRVLDALQVRELTPVAQIHHGAVHCLTPEGRSVVTRPGSFGERDSLVRIAAHLATERLT
ncbi:four-carbon acid sugar kinase family protein [Nonomuraea rubra]|uniref:four-carbon acid sugar kinase family protein n=1 Tax=Nonomuraea rubra TaxID=46180 RepID=UPI0033ECAC26